MKVFFVILIFLVGTVVPLPYQLNPNHFSRRLLNDLEAGKMQPPKAKKVKHEMKMFDDVRTDNYHWLRNDSDPNVLAYLQEENNYTDFVMSGTKHVEAQIYADIIGRIKEDGISAPRRRGSYYYYERSLAGKEFCQYCRRLALNDGDEPSVYDVMPTGPDSAPEYVILDVNVRAQGHIDYNDGYFTVSPNHMLAAYTESVNGDQNYTAYFIDAESGKPLGESLIGLTYKVVWAGNKTLLYTTMDATQRQEKVWLHKLGEKQANDLCLYHEKDDTFFLSLHASETKEFVFVGLESENTSYIFYFDIANPEYGLIPLTPRIDGVKTSLASHRGTHFFIKRQTEEIYNSELIACPVSNVSAIKTIVPHRESVKITGMHLFSNHMVVSERENGLTKLIIFNLPLGEPIQLLQRSQAIEFMDPAYAIYQLDSDFSSSILRFYYGSLKTPETVFDYDMYTGISVIKRTETVLGGFDSSNYYTDRKWATSSDGCQVPMSIVYRKDLVKLDGTDPLLLYGYGAYEYSEDPFFRTSILPLLDRGFIYVIAHVRGGGEMGKQWSINGKLLKKKNTFSDFIACAEFLIEMKYSTNEKLVIDGFDAGGLLIGAVINMQPDLFKAAIAESSFLDVLTTLLDPTKPSMKSEWEEFGDPHEEEFYSYIKSYSPVDNVSAQTYPSILLTTGLNYYRPYSDSAKFVAKLRDMKIGESLLLLKSDLSVGSSGKFRRFENYKKKAFVYAFMLKALNMLS